MNLVSGHQRISVLDSLEGTDDYQLDFAMVDLDDNEEKAANIAFNNESAFGQWGFDRSDLEMILPDTGFFGVAEERDSKSPILEEVEKVAADAAKSTSPAKWRNLPDRRRSAEGITEARNEARAANDDDTEHYAVLLFADRAARESFMISLGEDADARYTDGEAVRRLMSAASPRA